MFRAITNKILSDDFVKSLHAWMRAWTTIRITFTLNENVIVLQWLLDEIN